MEIQEKPINTKEGKIKDWFDDLINTIKVDQLMIETKTASKEKSESYDKLIFGSESEINHSNRLASSMHFIKGLLNTYIKEVFSTKKRPLRLAMDISDSKILVWAEINDNDYEAEKALILSEAKSNAKYYEYGFHITSTIIEKSDNLNIPPHYQSLLPIK